MRIFYVNITRENVSKPFLKMVKDSFERITRDDTEVTIKSVEPGLERANDPLIPYFGLLNKTQIVARILEASKEGYDAAVVGCFADPGVVEARSVVNIPVIGIAESTMLFACLLGKKFAIVTVNEPSAHLDIELSLRYHGLQERAINNPIRLISIPTFDAFTKGMEDPKLVIDDILDKARGCVVDGADVVIVGCNGLGPMLTNAGITSIENGKVPILDPVAIGIKMAEFLVDVRKKVELPTLSRARFPLARDKDIARVNALFGLT